MGLDMYLSKKTYVQNWDHHPAESRFEVTVKRGGKEYSPIQPGRVKYVEEEVAYWRKANAIHRWFVENVQNGTDDCGTYYVSREQLAELVALCKDVLNTIEMVDGKVVNGFVSAAGGPTEPVLEDGQVVASAGIAASKLPTQSGFFFGSTEYDQYYVQDLQLTVKQLEPLLTEEGEGDFFYHSSW